MPKSAPTAVSSGMRGNAKSKMVLDRLSIEIAENGFEVSKSMKPEQGSKYDCAYEPSKSFVFNSPEDVVTYIAKELGSKAPYAAPSK